MTSEHGRVRKTEKLTVRDPGFNFDHVSPRNIRLCTRTELPGGARPRAHVRCTSWGVSRRRWRSRAQGQTREEISSQHPFVISLKARGKQHIQCNGLSWREPLNTRNSEAKPKHSQFKAPDSQADPVPKDTETRDLYFNLMTITEDQSK